MKWFRTFKGSRLAAGIAVCAALTQSMDAHAGDIGESIVEQAGASLDAEGGGSHMQALESPGPGTLFQWSYGNSGGGGPDLDEPLVTDRPDFTEASSTVGNGVVQLEAGYTFTENSDDGTQTQEHSIGEPLFRIGMFADWFELRIAVFPTQFQERSATSRINTGGTGDLYLGAKIGLTPQEGILPEMAIIPQMTVPTGSNAFTDEEALPGVNWLYAWDLTDEFSLAGSTQFNRARDDAGESYTEWAQSIATGVSLTDELGAYTEWYALFPSSSVTANPEHYFNGGFAYLISNDIQFDVRAGLGLNDSADDYFVGTGLSIRFRP